MAKANAKPTSQQRRAIRQSAALFALSKLADKDADRGCLPEGGKFKVEGAFRGKVDGQEVTVDVDGKLVVGHNTESSKSSGPKPEHLLALFLDAAPKTKREALLKLPEKFSKSGELPAADPELVSACSTLLKSLRSRETITKRGSVHFQRSA